MLCTSVCVPTPRPPQELFEQLDADRSGNITLEELSQGLRKQGYMLTDNEIEQLMRKVWTSP